MKKIFLLLIVLFIMGCLTTYAYAEEEKDGILIKTIDNTDAIEIFKSQLNERSSMLLRNGFGENSTIGTPFSVEVQAYDPSSPYISPDGKNIYLFYFPIINDGKLVNYVEQHVNNDGNISWAVTNFFYGERDLEQLRDGNAYAIIKDKSNYNELAISDNKTITLWHDPDCPIDYNPPYDGKETKTVNILEPLNIDTSSVIPQTDEEKTIFENAEANGKTVEVKNADSLGAININSRLLVPLRDIAELIGCTVEWDSNERAAYASKDGTTVKFIIGRTEYSINDEVHTLDVPAEIYNSKTYIPFRAAGEALGIEIAYDYTSKNVTFSY